VTGGHAGAAPLWWGCAPGNRGTTPLHGTYRHMRRGGASHLLNPVSSWAAARRKAERLERLARNRADGALEERLQHTRKGSSRLQLRARRQALLREVGPSAECALEMPPTVNPGGRGRII
jgi:hypothetical protein